MLTLGFSLGIGEGVEIGLQPLCSSHSNPSLKAGVNNN